MSDQIDYMEGFEKPAIDLNKLTEYAIESDDLQNELDTLAVKQAELESRRDEILRRLIPEMMEQAGLESFKMANGATIGVKNEIKASISQANAPKAFAWLTEHDFDGIIKTKVISAFGRGELEEAQKLLDQLESDGVDAALKQEVHPSTLKSFVKERLEEGDDIPLDVFGVFEYKIAKITKPRK